LVIGLPHPVVAAIFPGSKTDNLFKLNLGVVQRALGQICLPEAV